MNSDHIPEKSKIDFECSTCNKINESTKKIPVQRIIEKLDAFFAKNDLESAKRLLEYWQNEAQSNADLTGELSVVNEMLGLYRRTQDKEKGQKSVERALELLSLTNTEKTFSSATILINAATTSKAFGNPQKAVGIYEKAQKIFEENNIKKDDFQYAALYNNYATALVDIKEFEKAEKLYKQAIDITGKITDKLLDCAVSHINLAHLYDEKEGENFEQIDECLKKAESIFNNPHINQDAYYAFVVGKCAPSFEYFGYFATAQELEAKAREIYERA